MADVIGTLGRRESGEGWPHRRPQARHRTRGDRTQAGFACGKDLLDGIEVRAVRRQIEQVGADGFNRWADPGHFMTGQIVEDDAVARLEGGGEDLFNIRHKGGAIDRPVEDRGGGELVGAERGNARRRLPLAGGDLRHAARAAPTPARAPGPLCLQSTVSSQEDESLPVPLRWPASRQCCRATRTSGRSCAVACRTFFDGQAKTPDSPPDRGEPNGHAQGGAQFGQRRVGLRRDQGGEVRLRRR